MIQKLLFIGTGSSLGIPVIGCHCEVCLSTHKKNKRWRSSAILNWQGKKILIDASPDLRSQALHYHIEHLDGVILTHAHYDHTAGLDELRIFHFLNKKPLPCLMSVATADNINPRFSYMFESQFGEVKGSSRLEQHLLQGKFGKTHFLGIPIKFLTYTQLGMEVNGFVLGSLAYVTDIKEYDSKIIHSLKGVKTLVLSALRQTPSHMHLSIDEAVAFAQEVGAEKTWLTHIAHELEHEKTNHSLPSAVQLAYDGLEIEIDDEL